MELSKEHIQGNRMISSEKKLLRKELLLKRNHLPMEYRKKHSARICEALWYDLSDRSVKSLHIYISMGSEVETTWLIKTAQDHNMTVLVPKILKAPEMVSLKYNKGENLKKDKFETFIPVKEQLYENEIDAVVVPGISFDKNGFRLGYGGGYYDFFLKNNPTLYSVGICFPSQICNSLPVENHDIQVKKIFC